MADRIGFHLDEHVDPAVAFALRRIGIDVTTTIEAGLRASDDESQLAFAQAEGRVMVTRDSDFLRMADRTANHPGIAFFSANQSIREVIDGLILIYEVLTPEEMTGRVEYL